MKIETEMGIVSLEKITERLRLIPKCMFCSFRGEFCSIIAMEICKKDKRRVFRKERENKDKSNEKDITIKKNR